MRSASKTATGSRRGRWGAIALFGGLGIALAIALYCHPSWHLLFNRDEVVCWLETLGPWSVLGFIGAHIVATAVGVPGTVLVLAGGVVFGVFYGTLWSVIGATLGAIAAFALARTLLRDSIMKRWGHSSRLQRLNQRLERSPLAVVLAVRFAPVSPFNVANFLFGLTPISLRTYAIGTFFGIIPGTALYTWTGSSGARMLSGGNPAPFAIAISALVILSILPLILRRKY
ncbi:MAG: TVP38/TMEM64 family protein [Cyanophyceae cyanobacterium]